MSDDRPERPAGMTDADSGGKSGDYKPRTISKEPLEEHGAKSFAALFATQSAADEQNVIASELKGTVVGSDEFWQVFIEHGYSRQGRWYP